MADVYRKNSFTQVIDLLPIKEFRRCVKRYRGDYKIKVSPDKRRWQIELFFKVDQATSTDQSLFFYGTSENAVKIQIWIVISMYILVAIIKNHLNLDLSLYTILQILSVLVFEKVPIIQVLTTFNYEKQACSPYKQLLLFDLCSGSSALRIY